MLKDSLQIGALSHIYPAAFAFLVQSSPQSNFTGAFELYFMH